MSFNEKISYPIGGKQVQGGLPTASQILLFNVVTNQWEFVNAAPGQTFARVVKKVDQTKNNDDALADDDELVIALNANKTYGYYLLILLNSLVAPDIKLLLSVPAGGSASKDGIVRGDILNNVTDATAVLNLGTSGVDQVITFTGRIIVAGVAGNAALQWAQLNSDAGDTKILQGSFFVVWEKLP